MNQIKGQDIKIQIWNPSTIINIKIEVSNYEGHPESKFPTALKKETQYNYLEIYITKNTTLFQLLFNK